MSRYNLAEMQTRAFASILLMSLLVTSACKHKPAEATNGPNALIPPPPVMPEYTVAPGLEAKQPQIVKFMNQFMQTCLAGDYDRYRDLVSRYENPESRERFQAIYHSLKQMEVSAIDTLPPNERASAAYLVTCGVEFREGSVMARRSKPVRRLAFMIVEEQGALRVRRAPAKLQPHERESATESQPASESQPSFPWDIEAD